MAPAKKLPAAKKTKAAGKVRVGLTANERRFVEEYLSDLNGTQAYLRVFPATTERSASTLSSRLLGKVDIQEAISQGKKDRSERTGINADRALQEVWNIVTADPRELVEYRVGCCRFCWGAGFQYQRTDNEMARDEQAHEADQVEKKRKDEEYEYRPFDVKGGTGYLKSRDPHPECPECVGEGLGRTVIHDTRKISAGAASLFAGIKETKEGIEIKTHSKDAMLEKVFRHLALYRDRLEVTGKNGGPIEQVHSMSDADLLAIAASAAKKA